MFTLDIYRTALEEIAAMWPADKDPPTWDAAFNEDTFDDAAEDGYSIGLAECAAIARRVLTP